jgi:fluoroquinolone resistance protein
LLDSYCGLNNQVTHQEMLDLSSLIHSQTDHADQVFKDVHLERDQLVSNQFYDCEFVRCSFVESEFRNCRFVNCVFRHCDLSLARVPGSTFSATRFEESKVIGVNWTQAEWPATGLGDPVGFFKSAISHSTFIGLRLKGIQIKDCVAADVDFREADLSQADLAGTDLSGSMFGNTDLTQADLSRARNYTIDPGQNVLSQAKFSLPEAMSLLYSLDIVLVEDPREN